MLKNALIFAVAALVVGLSAPSFIAAFERYAAPGPVALAPPAPTKAAAQADTAASGDFGFRQTSVAADPRGQFHADALIEGVPVEMLIDTGATVVAISAGTAARLGVSPDPGAPKWRMNTANGVSFASPVILRRVTIGSIDMSDVQAVVMPASAGEMDLLGASFLKRLASVEQRDGVLLLKQ